MTTEDLAHIVRLVGMPRDDPAWWAMLEEAIVLRLRREVPPQAGSRRRRGGGGGGGDGGDGVDRVGGGEGYQGRGRMDGVWGLDDRDLGLGLRRGGGGEGGEEGQRRGALSATYIYLARRLREVGHVPRTAAMRELMLR